jgi:hypothetical protein
MEISTKIERAHVDLLRYLDFRDLGSYVQVAEKWQISPETAKLSIRNGQRMHESQQQLQLRQLKYDGALTNETIRQEIRDFIQSPDDAGPPKNRLIAAIQTLLKGERPVVSDIGGQKVVQYIIDPEVVAMGLKELREAISLAEKPAQNQTTVNIQQNNMGGEGSAAGGDLTYEDRLARVRARQRGERPVIEAQARTIEDVKPVEAELIEPDDKQEGDWGF